MINMKTAPNGLPQGLTTRAQMRFQPSTLRESDYSVEFVLATESPAEVWSWDDWEVIREVLVASGVEVPDSGQIPLQDSHNRSTIINNLGAVREIRVEKQGADDQVIGRLFFDAGDDLGLKAFNKIKNGFLDSGSVGYEVVEKQRIKENEFYDHNGKRLDGPLQLTHRWRLKEFSIVAIGADHKAKVRNEVNPSPIQADNQEKEATNMAKEPADNKTMGDTGEIDKRIVEVAAKEAKAKELLERAERLFVDTQINELCSRHECKDLGTKLVAEKATIEDAQRQVIDILATKAQPIIMPTSPEIEMGTTDVDKKRDAISGGLLLRGFPGGVMGTPAPGANEHRNRTLIDIAKECLEAQGINTRGWTASRIARTTIDSTRASGVTDLASASFANITENVANKAAMKGFASQGAIWPDICQVGSTRDFKTVSRVGLSESADLQLKQAGTEYRSAKFSDRKESGAVGRYAQQTILTEEAMINDEIGLLTTIPFRQGAAAMRVPETLLFYQINNPPTLATSGRAWFNTGNSPNNDMNHADGLTAKNLAAAVSRLKGAQPHVHSKETTTDYLDLPPKVLLVHTDEEFTAKIVSGSVATPESSMSSGVANPLKDLNLLVRASGRLSVPTTFHLFADPNLYPVVEMLFLDGRVEPEVFIERLTNIDGIAYKIRMTCGIIVLEHRTALRFRKA